MATDIGPLTAKITGSTQGLEKALDQAPGKIRASAGKMEKASKEAGEKAGEAAGIGWAGKFGLAMAGGAALGGAAVVGIAALYSAGADAIREVGAAAAGAVMPVNEFQGLVSAFSGNAQDATDAAVKLSAALSKAAMTGEGAELFDRLGLDPQTALASKNAFEDLADAISQLPTGFAQASAASGIFGEDYKKFLPVLQRGGEYLREQKSILEGFGAGITGSMVASVQRADRMFAQLSALWQGLKIQTAAGLAPVIGAFTEMIPRLDRLGLTFQGLGEGILGVAEGAAKLGAAIYEAFTNPQIRGALFTVFGEAAEFLGLKMVQALNFAVGTLLKNVGTIKVGPFSIDMGSRGDVLLAAAGRARFDAALKAQDMGDSWDSLTRLLRGSRSGAFVSEMFGRARELFSGSGLAPMADQGPQVWLETARKMAEALDNPIQKFADAVGRVEKLQETRPDALMIGAGMIGENQLPWRDRTWIADPNGGPSAGEIGRAMFEESGLLAAGKAVQDLLAGSGSSGPQFAGAMLAGSREAYSAILAAQYQGAESIQEQIAAAIDRGNKQRERQIELGRQGLEAMKGMRAVKVGGLD